MLTVEQALAAILAEVARAPAETIPLEASLGQILAEEIVSDDDSPPFNKALMDGYAVRAADVTAESKPLRVIEQVTAGQVPRRNVGPGEATRIMTGAPIPDGADAVVPIEETELVPSAAGQSCAEQNHDAGELVRILSHAVRPGASVLPRGAATKQGDRVLSVGRELRPQEVAALAELGKGTVQVFRSPRVAVLATGDELVPATAIPGPGQIRNSNEPMLVAQVRRAGGIPVPLGVARDERAELRARIQKGLECDMLLLSGGVSAGKLDLVPSELAEAGVRQVFHKIQMKPGKPLWFGVYERPPVGLAPLALSDFSEKCYVFGLPGNPVSSMVCCELFVRAALRRVRGVEPAVPSPLRARLTEAYSMQGNRPTYHPASLAWESDGPTVRVVDWLGSADLRATVDANALAVFPAGDRLFAAGEVLDVIPW